MTDQPPVLVELFKLLPAPGQPFDPFDRKRWLDACAAVLEVAYPRHVAAIAPVAVQARPMHACPDCTQTFGSVLDLDSHRRRFHGLIRAPLDIRATIDQDAARRRAAEAI